MFPFDSEEECAPSRSGDTTCRIFAWIGQSPEFCDECGNPYWVHLFNPTYGGTKGKFRVKHYVKYKDRWVWRDVNPIPDAEAVRARWEGHHARTSGRLPV